MGLWDRFHFGVRIGDLLLIDDILSATNWQRHDLEDVIDMSKC
jgi:hypothetical protein